MLTHDLSWRIRSGGGSRPCSQHVGYFKVHLEVWILFAATLLLPLCCNICLSQHRETVAALHRKAVEGADFPLELIF